MSLQTEIIEIISTIITNQRLAKVEVLPASNLYDDGLGLDSLCVAELSATLEKKYGKDPYTSGVLPQTILDIVDFYSA